MLSTLLFCCEGALGTQAFQHYSAEAFSKAERQTEQKAQGYLQAIGAEEDGEEVLADLQVIQLDIPPVLQQHLQMAEALHQPQRSPAEASSLKTPPFDGTKIDQQWAQLSHSGRNKISLACNGRGHKV